MKTQSGTKLFEGHKILAEIISLRIERMLSKRERYRGLGMSDVIERHIDSLKKLLGVSGAKCK